MSTVEKVCSCGKKFTAKLADLKRGWAKSCSKSCAATKTNKKTGNYKNYVTSKRISKYAEEFGGSPQFNSKGEYDGFCGIDHEHDSNKD